MITDVFAALLEPLDRPLRRGRRSSPETPAFNASRKVPQMTAQPERIPVLLCVANAFRFLGSNWIRFLPAAFVVALISTFSALLSTGAVAQFGFSLVSGLAGVAFAAAIIRKVLNDEYKSPIGLALGADEFRLFAATIAVILLLLPAGFILFMITAGILVARLGMDEAQLERMSQDPEAMRAALIDVIGPGDLLLGLVILLPLLWLSARFFFVNPGTMSEGKVVVLESWTWSRGHAWRIMIAIVLTSAPLLAFSAFFMTMGPGLMGQSPITSLLLIAGSSTVSAILRIPIIALSAILFLGLRPPS